MLIVPDAVELLEAELAVEELDELVEVDELEELPLLVGPYEHHADSV
jgi:hypothetical protein